MLIQSYYINILTTRHKTISRFKNKTKTQNPALGRIIVFNIKISHNIIDIIIKYTFINKEVY